MPALLRYRARAASRFTVVAALVSGQIARVAHATPSVTSVPISVNHGQKISPWKARIHQSRVAGMLAGQ